MRALARRRAGGQAGWQGGAARAVERRSWRQLQLLIVVAMFVLGGVAGFGWAQDRQLRGGLLRQAAAAQRRPDWVPLRALPVHLPRAFLAVVDPTYLGRGVLSTDAAQPTLSRELVRQVHQLGPGARGRARELVMAPLLERHLSRAQLLELFLNRVDLGRSGRWPVSGVHHAAEEYFGKPAAQLTASEAATLAALLLPPRIEEPAASPGAVGIRRNEVLAAMRAAGWLSEEAYRAARAEPLRFQPGIVEPPMSRPADWQAPPPLLRLPPELQPSPDTASRAAPAAP